MHSNNTPRLATCTNNHEEAPAIEQGCDEKCCTPFNLVSYCSHGVRVSRIRFHINVYFIHIEAITAYRSRYAGDVRQFGRLGHYVGLYLLKVRFRFLRPAGALVAGAPGHQYCGCNPENYCTS